MTETPCIEHSGRSKGGYKTVKVNGRCTQAHRVAFATANGRDVFTLGHIRHKCDNPRCINPGHLEEGTHQDNMQDMMTRERQAKGTRKSNHVLTEQDVAVIRNTYVPYHREFGGSALARKFGVDQSVVSEVVNQLTWRHV